jgi:hypothetical protein
MKLNVLPRDTYETMYEGMGIPEDRLPVVMKATGELMDELLSGKPVNTPDALAKLAEICDTQEEVAMVSYVAGCIFTAFEEDPYIGGMVSTLKAVSSSRRKTKEDGNKVN